MNLAFFTGGRPGIWELLIILLVLLLLFGAKKLPDLARSIGKSINEFKKGREESPTTDDKADEGADKKE